MCTVTYLPKKHGFILTSNRDEHISRKNSKPPKVEKDILYPKDGEAGGTWIGISKQGRTLCLLNGAFIRHQRKNSYRKSRGLVVLELFGLKSINTLLNSYSLKNIEPFTLIWVESTPKIEVHEFRWDGKKKFHKKLKSKTPYIWSSSTLYDDEIKSDRKKWFSEFLIEHIEPQPYHLVEFHKNAGSGDPENDVKMKRSNGVQTTSTTQVNVLSDNVEFFHQNYVSTNVYNVELKLSD